MIDIIDIVFTAHYREKVCINYFFFRFNDFDTEKGNLSVKKMFTRQLKLLHNHH